MIYLRNFIFEIEIYWFAQWLFRTEFTEHHDNTIPEKKYKNVVQEQAIFQNLRYIWFSIIGQLLSSQHRLVYLSSVWLFTSQHRINSTFSLNLYCAFFTQSEGNSSFPEKYMIVWKPIKLWMRSTKISKIIFSVVNLYS